jgi:tetratricopeptide (TPR) repeat protein
MKKLNNRLQAEIERLCEAGDSFAKKDIFSFALRNYWMAYDLLPEPKEEWLAGTWILVAIGDTNFLNKDYQAGIDNLSTALRFPSGAENSFLHLRLGQCYYESGRMNEATDEFTKAYRQEGEDFFENEDPKYFELIQSKFKEEFGTFMFV